MMTSGTFGGRALEYIINMAFLADNSSMCTIQLEGRKVVVKSGGFPSIDGMTGAALLSKFAVVVIVFLVTGKTIGRRAFEDIIDVAIRAFCFGVFAFQLES